MAPPFGVDLRHVDTGDLLRPGQHDRGEGLVDLDGVDVGHGQVVALEQPLGGVDRAGEHQHGVDADEALVDDPGSRREAELAALSAVVTSTAAAPSEICDDVPAVCTPSSRATGLQLGEPLPGGLPEALVALDPLRLARGLAVLAEDRRVDGEDLPLEAALGPCRRPPAAGTRSRRRRCRRG
jgi:hypothetical protein